jgi:hypothetical protein
MSDIIKKLIVFTVFLSFYFICYFLPHLFILFRKNNEENSDVPIKGFHKLNALLFSFVCLSIICVSLLIVAILVFFTPENTSFIQKLSIAASWVWNNENINVWIAMLTSLIIGYSMYTLYFIISPKELKDKLLFPRKIYNDDEYDEEQETDEEWEPEKNIYKMLLAMVMSIFLFTLSLMSLYSYNSPQTNYFFALSYICAIAVLFVTIEWIYTIPLLLPFFIIFAMQKNIYT